MGIINSVLSRQIKKRYREIEHFMKYPYEVQETWFKKLINAGKHTEWGKQHGYDSIDSIDQYKKQVPVSSYDTIKTFIDKIMQGQQNILWNTPVKWFAKSSGTTSDRSKYIPISKESLTECHFKGGKDMLSIYCTNNPNTKLFTGKSLAMGGSHKLTRHKNFRYHVGDLSAVIIQNLPFWAEFLRTPKRNLALHDKWEEKINNMAHIAAEQNITNISGVPSWTLILLKIILEIKDKKHIHDVWPNLEVFFHGGVNFDPYKHQFDNIISPSDINYFEIYNASEGFFGMQDQKNSKDLLLMLDYGIFYEFLPVDQLEEENPKVLNLDEIETGVNYALIISTNGGLWRYTLGDTVKFTSVSPFRMVITGRTKNFINAVGEEVIVDNAEKAMSAACQENNAIVNEYTAAPVYFSDDNNAAHEWLIEFDKKPEDIESFTNSLDKALQSVNSDYEAKRYNDMVLRKPVVHDVPHKTFYKWMKKRGKLGGQNKVPRLANNRKYIDEILNMI